jgi:hypothetical protein
MGNPGAQYWVGIRPEASACWPGPVAESAWPADAVRVQRAVTAPGSRARRHGGAVAVGQRQGLPLEHEGPSGVAPSKSMGAGAHRGGRSSTRERQRSVAMAGGGPATRRGDGGGEEKFTSMREGSEARLIMRWQWWWW